MRLKPRTCPFLPLAVFCLLTFSSVAGLAQSSPVQTNIWVTATTERLLQAAQSGDAGAQYYYWVRKMDEAWKLKQTVFAEPGTSPGNIEAQRQAVDAFEWAKRSAAQQFPNAEYDVAGAYLQELNWIFVPANQPEGLKLLQSAADHGVAKAQYLLATYYLAGQIFPTDLPKAIYYLQEAADQNNYHAQYRLAMLYANGNGQPRSEGDSPLGLLRKSAKNGFRPAAYALAERYRIGLGLDMDYVQSIQFYLAAQNPDDPYGKNSQPNADMVFRFMDQNLEPKLAVPFILRDFVRALSLYLKATQKQDPAAMEQIGEWYLNGRFEPKDLVEACRWFARAADHGAPGAAAKRDATKLRLTPGQLQQLR